MNSLTIGVIALIVVFMIIGALRGFVRSALGIILSVVSVIVAYLFVPVTTDLIIKHTNVDDVIESKIKTMIEDEIEDRLKKEIDGMELGNIDIDESVISKLKKEVLNTEPDKNQQIDIINNLGISEALKNALIENNNFEIKNEMGASGFYDYLTKYITKRIINLIAYIITFVIIGLVFTILIYVLKLVVKLPVVNGLNRIGGAAFGFVEAVIIIWILFLIVDNLPDYPVCVNINNQINESGLLTFMHEKNILFHLLDELKK
ncbi:MAG: CvpA family protein [Lachnospiraceae bacterium]|nr:CvpA family protein [Lachnospiraceae bacterium]